MEYLLQQFQLIANKLQDKKEFTIIEKYGKITRRYAIGLSSKIFNFFLHMFDVFPLSSKGKISFSIKKGKFMSSDTKLHLK